MPGKAREARPLPRMVRMMISRNGLRRPADRVESAVVVTLLAAFVAAVAAAAFIGARIYQSQSASAARLRPSVAVLTSSGPGTSLSGYGQAQARWREPDRTRHLGRGRRGPGAGVAGPHGRAGHPSGGPDGHDPDGAARSPLGGRRHRDRAGHLLLAVPSGARPAAPGCLGVGVGPDRPALDEPAVSFRSG